MAKVYLDEITAALSFSTFDTLSSDITDATSVDKAITSFTDNSSTILIGDVWDEARGKLEQFQTALTQRMNAASILGDAIKQALTLLNDYMEGYEYMDYTELPQLEATFAQLEASIANLESQIITYERVTTDKGNNSADTVEVFHQDIQDQVNSLKKEKEKLEQYITKVKGFEAVYNQAIAILDGAMAEISKFASIVDSITPSQKYYYTGAV